MDKMLKMAMDGAVQNLACPTIPIYISRASKVCDLEKKIQRILNAYLFFTLKLKIMVSQFRLWKSKYADEEADQKLKEIDTKHSNNYTHVKINAECINKTKEQQAELLTNVDISDTDLLIVELPNKDKDFVF